MIKVAGFFLVTLLVVMFVAFLGFVTARLVASPAISAVAPVAHAPVPTWTSASTPTLAPLPSSTPRPRKVMAKPTADRSMLTLRAAAGNTQVQVFSSISGGGGAAMLFRDGTKCTKLGGPVQVSEGGVSMNFYNVECNGRRGYVNTKWAR